MIVVTGSVTVSGLVTALAAPGAVSFGQPRNGQAHRLPRALLSRLMRGQDDRSIPSGLPLFRVKSLLNLTPRKRT